MSHPASAKLRQIAAWLDERGEHIGEISLTLRLANESPSNFAKVVTNTEAKVDSQLDHTVFAHGQLFGMRTMLMADKSKVGRVKTVTREEFVIGGES